MILVVSFPQKIYLRENNFKISLEFPTAEISTVEILTKLESTPCILIENNMKSGRLLRLLPAIKQLSNFSKKYNRGNKLQTAHDKKPDKLETFS